MVSLDVALARKPVGDLEYVIGVDDLGVGHKQSLDDLTIPNVLNHGVSGDGDTDNTAKLIDIFKSGGDWYFPEGNYLIAAAGPDAGGVYAEITKSLRVRCHPNARFFTNGLDNDMIRLTVPADGVGLPEGGVDFFWTGGIFDQQGQKNSTSMPFVVDYPPANPGTSATAEALSLRGEYTDGAAECGIRSAIIRDVNFISGIHWQTAGGDSNIFFSGCARTLIEGCYFRASRDVAIYASRDGTGVAGGPAVVRDNVFVNCVFGVAIKRSLSSFLIAGNTAINCIIAWQVDPLVGSGTKGGQIVENEAINCTTVARVRGADGVLVFGNTSLNMGAYPEDGTTIFNPYNATAIILEASSSCIVKSNRVLSVDPGWIATQCYILYSNGYDFGSGVVKSTYNISQDNTSLSGSGIYGLGSENPVSAENNRYISNQALGSTLPNMVNSFGTGSTEERIGNLNSRDFRNPVLMADGTVSLPILARSTQTSTGLYFATNQVNIGVAGVRRIGATNTGVFMNLPIYPDDAAAGAAGLTTGFFYKTATGEVRVKI